MILISHLLLDVIGLSLEGDEVVHDGLGIVRHNLNELRKIGDMIPLRQWNDLRRIGRQFEFGLKDIRWKWPSGILLLILGLDKVEVGERYEGN
jgi:hypothetical protein